MKLSDSEDESSTAGPTRPQQPLSKRSESKSAARVKKGVILSDDEEEAPKPARTKSAYKTKTKTRSRDLDIEAESELRAMMDIDDGRKDAFVRARSLVEGA